MKEQLARSLPDDFYLQKHWVSTAKACLDDSLSTVPHEINELDWKLNLSEKKERLAEHLMAFANYPGGGFLAFGIQDDNGQVQSVAPAIVAGVVNTLANLGRDAVEPSLVIDHAVVDYHGDSILLVFIPESNHKPTHRRGKSIEETWVRSGGTTRKASRQEVGALMLNSPPPRWENLRSANLMAFDDAVNTLDLEGIAKLLRRPLPADTDALARWLTDEGFVKPEGRGYYVTNLAAAAAARNLQQFPALERKPLRIIRYRGTNKVNAIDETVSEHGYAVGFENLIGGLKKLLPHSEVIERSLRVEVAMYPEIALRELLANSLVHQDFTITGAGPMIEIFDDRIDFTNPGSLLPGKRIDRLIGATPQSRNESLASAFRRYHICEERGTGFQKVVTAVELFGMPPIAFASLENAFRVTLYAPRSFSEMSQAERIEACYQHAVLQFISNQSLTNTSLRERFRLHIRQRTQIANLIRDAIAAKRIKRKNVAAGKKFAEYLPYWT